MPLSLLPAAFSLVALMIAVSSFVTGLSLWDAQDLARACVCAGLAAGGCAWHTSVPSRLGSRLLRDASRISFCLTAGMAVTVNMAWSLSALGVPVAIPLTCGPHGHSGAWLGPALIVSTLVCYAAMHWLAGWDSDLDASSRLNNGLG